MLLIIDGPGGLKEIPWNVDAVHLLQSSHEFDAEDILSLTEGQTVLKSSTGYYLEMEKHNG